MKTYAAFLGAAFTVLAGTAFAQSPKIVMEEAMVPTAQPGISVYVRNKHRADMTSFRPDRTLLFVHGSTYPAETAFDLPLGGKSWMDYIAEQGYDVYLVDLPGYGKSTRPKEMEEPADKHTALTRGEVAVPAIGSAVDYILKRRNLAKLDLLGWSWGTTLMATYTTQHPDKVEKLVLYAPQWIRTTPSLVQAGSGPIGAYRTVAKETAKQRWYNGVPENKKADLIPAGWFEQWADATWATDPESGKHNPALLRAPNGTVQDTHDYWSAGKAYYDPAKITVPTLLIQAEWDRDTPPYMAQTLFPLLVNAPTKRYVWLAEGTHTIIMEKNRMKLFEAVQAFLNEQGGS
ncbi:MAG: alpha/beta fold hydrolase [Pseudorhodoplanes sp.]